MRRVRFDIEFVPDTGEGRIRAASYLTILSREMPPEELARLVGIQPDEKWSKGEKLTPFVEGCGRGARAARTRPAGDQDRTPSDPQDAEMDELMLDGNAVLDCFRRCSRLR